MPPLKSVRKPSSIDKLFDGDTPTKNRNPNAVRQPGKTKGSSRQSSLAGSVFSDGQVRKEKDDPSWLICSEFYPEVAMSKNENEIKLLEIWGNLIKEDLTEAAIEKELTTRLEKTFAVIHAGNDMFPNAPVCRNQKVLSDNSRLDLIVTAEGTTAPVIVEFKRPLCYSDQTEHWDQMVTYGRGYFSENVTVGALVSIITDGNRFSIGMFKRLSPADFDYVFHEGVYELYKDGSIVKESLHLLLKAFYIRSSVLIFPSSVPRSLNGIRTNVQVEVKSYLASGGSSSVYLIQSGGDTYAMKMPKYGHIYDLDNEIIIRKALEGSNVGLPLYSHLTSICLVTALGCPARIPDYLPKNIKKLLEVHGKMQFHHFIQCLEKLRLLHQKGYIHRDIRLDNIILFHNEAYLNDFGATIPINAQPTSYKGSIETASDRVLQHYCARIEFKFEPIDDLESMFKCFLLWHLELKFNYEPGYSRTEYSRYFWNTFTFASVLPSDYEARFEYIKKHILDAIENEKNFLNTCDKSNNEAGLMLKITYKDSQKAKD